MNTKLYKVAINAAVVAGLLVMVLWLFSNIFIYLILSLILSAILKPVTNYLSDIQLFRSKVPRFVAVLLSFLLIVALFGGFILLFVPLIIAQVNVMSRINYDTLFLNLIQPVVLLEKWVIKTFHLNKPTGFMVDALRENIMQVLDEIEFGSLINVTLQFSISIFVGMLAVAFITFFLLYQKGFWRMKLISLIPNQYFELVITAMHKIEKLLSNYLLGLSLQLSSIFSFTAIGLTVAGINYPLTIAVFAALVNIVPYIGPVIGTLFALLVGLSTTSFAESTGNMYLLILIKVSIVFSVVHLIDNLILQPLIFSKSVKAHPLEIFIAVFAGAELAGPLGMIAAIPVYTIIRVSFLELKSGYRQYHIFKVYRK